MGFIKNHFNIFNTEFRIYTHRRLDFRDPYKRFHLMGQGHRLDLAFVRQIHPYRQLQRGNCGAVQDFPGQGRQVHGDSKRRLAMSLSGRSLRYNGSPYRCTVRKARYDLLDLHFPALCRKTAQNVHLASPIRLPKTLGPAVLNPYSQEFFCILWQSKALGRKKALIQGVPIELPALPS